MKKETEDPSKRLSSYCMGALNYNERLNVGHIFINNETFTRRIRYYFLSNSLSIRKFILSDENLENWIGADVRQWEILWHQVKNHWKDRKKSISLLEYFPVCYSSWNSFYIEPDGVDEWLYLDARLIQIKMVLFKLLSFD